MGLRIRIVGFASSLLLTLAAFFLAAHPDFFPVKVQTVVALLLVLAFFQATAQSICFIHLWREKGVPWNLLLFLSTIGMMIIIIVGSIWIMNHLNANMTGL